MLDILNGLFLCPDISAICGCHRFFEALFGDDYLGCSNGDSRFLLTATSKIAMNALPTTTTAPAQKAQRAAAGASRRAISAKSADIAYRVCAAVAIPTVGVFFAQAVTTGNPTQWVGWTACVALCLPLFIPAVEPETKEGGAL